MRLERFLHQGSGSKGRIYLDYAAATPVHEEVFEAMEPYFSDLYANPGAIHKEGVAAKKVIDDTRSSLAELLHVRPTGVTFTAHGTEANNLAIMGVVDAAVSDGKEPKDLEIVSTQIEHPSVLETLEVLKKRGMKIKYVKVSNEGYVDNKDFQKVLSKKTILVTCAHVNSEIGVVQDVKRLSRIIKKFNTDNKREILFHLDASQSPLWLNVELDRLGVDLMTLDAGKCYGPKGIGVLAMRHGVTLTRQMHGGDQERGLRAGTENVPLIAGCVKALERAQHQYESRAEKVAKHRDKMIEALKKIDGLLINGGTKFRVANNVNVSVPGVDSEFAVITLDARGIAASTKSACSGSKGGGSYVVKALTGDQAQADSTVRFTLGEETTSRDIERAAQILSEHVAKVRAGGENGTNIDEKPD